MALTSQTEIERKYDVGPEASPPGFRDIPGITGSTEPHTTRMVAVYYDTDDLTLARNRIALRRREGGADEGWHVKLPGSGGRTELQAGLTEDHRMPSELRARIEVFLRGREVTPLARVQTQRTTRELLGEDGSPVVEIADDRVSATNLRTGIDRSWREWEAELMGHADAGVLEDIEPALLAAGAVPSASGSKLARALGADSLGESGPERTQLDPGTVRADALPRSSGATPQTVVSATVPRAPLADAVGALESADSRVRGLEETDPDGCHDMRTAARRARTLIAALFPAGDDVAEAAYAELGRLGAALGEVRDLDVRAELLGRYLDPPAIPGASSAAVEETRDRLTLALGAERDLPRGRLGEHLDQASYFRLLDRLDDLASRPSAARRLVSALWTATERCRQSCETVIAGELATTSLADLHRLRKEARRTRYLAEAAIQAPPSDRPLAAVDTIAGSAKEIQDALGAHRDLVLLADWLDTGEGSAPQSREADDVCRAVALRVREAAHTALSALPSAVAGLRGTDGVAGPASRI